MNKKKLPYYTTIVNKGSGCLFQPSSSDYSYVLTAKHVLEDKNTIIRQILNDVNDVVQEELEIIGSPFVNNDVNKDAAIIKVKKVNNIESLLIDDSIEYNCEKYFLSGHPLSRQKDNYSFRDNKLEITQPKEYGYIEATLNKSALHHEVIGQSGGGIIKIEDSSFLLAGIQKKMSTDDEVESLGRIEFAPISFFDEIIKNNPDELSPLYPLYMKEFHFLLDDCFSLEVDEIDTDKIASARTTLRNKAYEITQSDITPIGIKELFKERLLINEKESFCLSHKVVWVSWLEFLVIMNLMKYEELNSNLLSEIFNSYRLKYTDADWTGMFRSDLLKTDYVGLKEDSTIVVNTRCAPKTNRHLLIPKGKMLDITQVYDKRGFRTDRGIDPYTSFNFVHLDFFKTKCIIEKLDEYQNLDEVSLIEKFKSEYNELFN